MKRDYLLSMIKELVAIPSVTESAEESAPGAWLRARLEKLPNFAGNAEGENRSGNEQLSKP